MKYLYLIIDMLKKCVFPHRHLCNILSVIMKTSLVDTDSDTINIAASIVRFTRHPVRLLITKCPQ